MNNNYQNNQDQPVDPASDLPWLALCYVANELDAKARRQFEIRLEHDQTARESVAQAFDNARLLDLAISSTNNQVATPTCQLHDRTPNLKQPLKPASSKPLWPKALLGIAATGLLAMTFVQLPWSQTETKVTLNTDNHKMADKSTEASTPLAETWADSDWQADSQAMTQASETRHLPEPLQDTAHDDWMTATLIDMATSLKQSGS